MNFLNLRCLEPFYSWTYSRFGIGTPETPYLDSKTYINIICLQNFNKAHFLILVLDYNALPELYNSITELPDEELHFTNLATHILRLL